MYGQKMKFFTKSFNIFETIELMFITDVGADPNDENERSELRENYVTTVAKLAEMITAWNKMGFYVEKKNDKRCDEDDAASEVCDEHSNDDKKLTVLQSFKGVIARKLNFTTRRKSVGGRAVSDDVGKRKRRIRHLSKRCR